MEKLLTPTQVAEWLQIDVATLKLWRHKQTGPQFVRVGGSIRYRQADVEAFIREGWER